MAQSYWCKFVVRKTRKYVYVLGCVVQCIFFVQAVDEDGVGLGFVEGDDVRRGRGKPRRGKTKRGRYDDGDDEEDAVPRRRRRTAIIQNAEEAAALKLHLKKLINIIINYMDM